MNVGGGNNPPGGGLGGPPGGGLGGNNPPGGGGGGGGGNRRFRMPPQRALPAIPPGRGPPNPAVGGEPPINNNNGNPPKTVNPLVAIGNGNIPLVPNRVGTNVPGLNNLTINNNGPPRATNYDIINNNNTVQFIDQPQKIRSSRSLINTEMKNHFFGNSNNERDMYYKLKNTMKVYPKGYSPEKYASAFTDLARRSAYWGGSESYIIEFAKKLKN